MRIPQPVADAFRGRQFKPTVILLVSCLLLLAWKYFCSADIYAYYFEMSGPRFASPQVIGAILYFASCFLLMGLVPVFIIKRVLGERLRDYGAGFGVPKRTLRSFLILAPVFVLAGYIGSKDASLLDKFPINPDAGQSALMFALHAATMLLFYVGWEFYFRGFMLFGLRDSLGDANAVLVQALASALLHIGDPASEVFGAVFAGLLWGMLALRTRSVLSGMGQHYLLGISLDWFICYG